MIGARELRAMKPTAVLVNTARGPIIDQGALAAALRAGEIFGAGLDVVVEEPIAVDDELLSIPSCLVLPHLGSATVATRSRMADMAVDNVRAGRSAESRVGKEGVGTWRERWATDH